MLPSAHPMSRSVLFALLLAAPLSAQKPADLIVTNARIYTVDDSPRSSPPRRTRRTRAVRRLGARSDAPRGANTKSSTPAARRSSPAWPTPTRTSRARRIPASVDLTDTRSYDEVIARVVARVEDRPGQLGHRARLGPEQVGRHPLPDARSAHARVAEQSRRARAHRRPREARQRGRDEARRRHRRHEGSAPADGSSARANGEPTGVFVDNAKELDRSRRCRRRRTMRCAAATLAAIAESNSYGLVGAARCRRVARRGSTSSRSWRRRASSPPRLRHDRRRLRRPRALLRARAAERAVRRPPLDPRDQALRRRRARLARRRAARSVHRRPEEHGLLCRTPAHMQRRRRRARCSRLPGRDARHRRPRQSRRARRVRSRAQGGADGRSPLPHRARADPQPRRHPALRRSSASFRRCRPSTRPATCTGPPTRLGYARTLGAYAWRSLLETGVVIPNGSDFPVESGESAASPSTRRWRGRTPNWPPGGWLPEQQMTREEALKSMTIWPAYAAFQEQDGLADSRASSPISSILDRDIMTVAGRQIFSARCGRDVYWRASRCTSGRRSPELPTRRVNRGEVRMVFQRPATDAESRAGGQRVRYQWLTPERQTQLRGVLLGITLFFGLVVWVWHSLGARGTPWRRSIRKLRILGIMTWLYAFVQLIDIRFWRSAAARKRRDRDGHSGEPHRVVVRADVRVVRDHLLRLHRRRAVVSSLDSWRCC